MCKVSVIVPNYNYANYLDKRIESILSQTYSDFELILLDDASTDGSVEVLNRYKDNPHVSAVVVNEQNSGSPFRQWMKGIGMAKGKWIWIAEADDLAQSDFLEACIYLAEKEDNVSLVFTDSLLIDAEGKVIDKRENGKRKQEDAVCFDGRRFAEYRLYWNNVVQNASSAVFRKENALKLIGHDLQEMRNCGDWIFWLEMSLMGKVGKINRPLNFFRFHLSQTRKGEITGNAYLEAMETIGYFDKRLSVRWSKRHACHGTFFRFFRNIQDKDVKGKLKKAYKRIFRSSVLMDYIYMKLNIHFRFLPVTVTEDKDFYKC